MPVRVLHVVSALDIGGGVQAMLMNIYRNIDRSKVQFDFVAYSVSESDCYKQEIENMGGRVFCIESPGENGIFKFIKNLIRIIKENGPYDVLHGHNGWQNSFVCLAGRMSRVKKIVTHSHTAPKGGSLFRKTLWGISKLVITWLSSDYLACSYEAGRFLFVKKTFSILPNVIDINKYTNVSSKDIEDLRKELNISLESMVIGHVGRFSTEKNQQFLVPMFVELLKEKPDSVLVFVGDGETRGKVEEQVKANRVTANVRFVGLRDDVPRFVNMFDVFVLPSLHEGLGMALIEAQAAGTYCVVSSNVPRATDMGLNLVKYIDLKDEYEAWNKEILDCFPKNGITAESRKKALEVKGYEIESSIKTLYKLYGI